MKKFFNSYYNWFQLADCLEETNENLVEKENNQHLIQIKNNINIDVNNQFKSKENIIPNDVLNISG